MELKDERSWRRIFPQKILNSIGFISKPCRIFMYMLISKKTFRSIWSRRVSVGCAFVFAVVPLTLLFSFISLSATPDEIARQVQATYEKAQNVSSAFTQKVKIEALEREIEKSGEVTFQKPGKLRVEYTGDRGRLYVSDGKKLWVYEKGDSQVNVYQVTPKTLPEETLAFLGGLGNLNKQFTVRDATKKVREKKITGNLDWLLLVPRQASSQLEEMLLGFNPTSHLVEEAYLKNETGNQSHYFFKKVVVNSKFEDSKFVFGKVKGVKEIRN